LLAPDGGLRRASRQSQARGEFAPRHPRILGVAAARRRTYADSINRNHERPARHDIVNLAHAGLDWVTFSTEVSEALRGAIAFDRNCWHTVDPGTVLFTGSLNQNVSCSGSWLAEHEYVLDDVNKWSFLAHSGRRARSARHRSQESYGIGDELRASFLDDGVYWGAAGFLRDDDQPWFTEEDVHFLASLSQPIAEGFRRALIGTITAGEHFERGPGVVVFDEQGHAESISPAAERWIEEMVEIPPPAVPAESKMVQIVAGRARALSAGQDPLEVATRSRVQTRSGRWLLLYGTRLTGGTNGRTAVIIQPATPNEVAPLVALAYGLSERERKVTRLCIKGRSTKQIAQTLGVSAYTVQDHLKSIFDKTGVHSRGELVGQVFLQHYLPRWEALDDSPEGWLAMGMAEGAQA